MTYAILLAAGQGRRFGGDKLMAPLAGGVPLAVQAARNLRAAGLPVLAAVRADATALIAALGACGCEIAPLSAENSVGMGDTLAAAVRACAASRGWIVALADMPAIQPASIARVAAALDAGARIAAPIHAGQRGHPVGFGAEWGAALAGLTGDAGARAILAAHPEAISRIEVEDAGVLADVDRPGDLARLPAAF